jgi:D-serine deaminase-like pyridoxal phosphate-dependent protein
LIKTEEPLLVSDLETPAVVVDLYVMERNLSRMADYCRDKNLRLRPHTKSHKIPELAKRQMAQAAQGITVAKINYIKIFSCALCAFLWLNLTIPSIPASKDRMICVSEWRCGC